MMEKPGSTNGPGGDRGVYPGHGVARARPGCVHIVWSDAYLAFADRS